MKAKLRDEEGFTLVEMMVTIMVMIIVLFALYSIFDMSLKVFSFGNDKVEAVGNARLSLEKMAREIRAAYPYDKGAATSDTHLFDSMTATQITFANDLGTGDRVIDQTTEEITYNVSGTTLQRIVGTGTAQAVAEHVDSLDIQYLKRSGSSLVTTTTDAEVEVVRITLVIEKDDAAQTITTDVDLRNRS